MNQVIIIGRTTRDAELRYIPGSGTSVANFTIAVDRNYKKSNGDKVTDFIPIETMGKTAEFVANYITKGRLIAVHGSLRVENYMEDEKRRTYTKVFAQSVNALDYKSKEEPPQAPAGFHAIDDDEIPF